MSGENMGVGGQRLSATQRAYNEIKKRIRDNVMTAGAQYLETELAEMLGLSRTPIREACIRLADEGMLEIRPRHGVRILPLSPDDMREIYDLLTELEAAAVRIIAQKPVSSDEIAELETAAAAMEAALAENDLDDWVVHDERFHKLLVEFTGNRRLKSVVDMFWDQVHRARIITLRLRPVPEASNKDHRAVIAAIRQGDAAEAERIHRQHRTAARDLLVGILQQFGLQQL